MPRNRDAEIRLVVQDELTKQYKRIQAEVGRANKKTVKGLKDLGKQSKKTSGEIKSSLLSAKTAMVAIGAFASGKLISSFIKAGSEVEDLTTQFKVLLGSTEAATARMKELEEFAQTTPFQLDQIAKASRILQTLTKGALATGDGLRLVGDTAAATGEDFQNLALHVGRAFDGLRNNRPVGESLARLQELGVVSGATRAQIEALTKQGLGVQAWELLEKQLEKNKGGMKELSKTVTGLSSTIKDQLQAAMRKILDSGVWDSFRELLGRIVDRMNKLLAGDTLNKIGDGLVFITNNLDKLAIAAGAFLGIWTAKKLAGPIKNIKKLNVTLSKTNVVLAAVSAGMILIDELFDNWNKKIAESANLDLMDEKDVEKLRTAATIIKNTREEVERLKSAQKITLDFQGNPQITGITEAEQLKIEKFQNSIKILQREYGAEVKLSGAFLDGILKTTEKQTEEIKKATAAQKDLNKATDEAGKKPEGKKNTVDLLKIDFFKKQQLQKEHLKNFQVGLDRAQTERIEKAREAAAKETEIRDKALKKDFENFQHWNNRRKKEEADAAAVFAATRDLALSGAASLTGALGNLAAVRGQNELKAAEAAGASEEKLKQIRKKSFDQQKQFSLKSAYISLAQAALAGYSQKPFVPVGLAAGTLALAAGGLQIQAIKEQKFARGGIVGGNNFSGDNVTAAVNSGELILNRAQQRNLLAIANGRGDSQARTINISFGDINAPGGDPGAIAGAIGATIQERLAEFGEVNTDARVHGLI